jgi:hypothetical protein
MNRTVEMRVAAVLGVIAPPMRALIEFPRCCCQRSGAYHQAGFADPVEFHISGLTLTFEGASMIRRTRCIG